MTLRETDKKLIEAAGSCRIRGCTGTPFRSGSTLCRRHARCNPKVERCEGCHQELKKLKDGLCAACTSEADLIRDCPGEVSADELTERFWNEENPETVRRPTMINGVVPEVGMRIFAIRNGYPEPAEILSFVGYMLCEAWVAFEDGERARRRVDKLLRWTAPEEPCTCTNEESDPTECARCRNNDYPYLGINSNA